MFPTPQSAKTCHELQPERGSDTRLSSPELSLTSSSDTYIITQSVSVCVHVCVREHVTRGRHQIRAVHLYLTFTAENRHTGREDSRE